MIEIEGGPTRLVLAPEIGGGLAALTWRDHPILRTAPPHPSGPLDLGEFPLLPYVNRIAHGRFTWRGRAIALDPDGQTVAHLLHGLGWRRPWRVMRQERDEARIVLDHAADAVWPWSFSAERRVSVRGDGAEIALSLTARGPDAMPAALGFHPYFPRAGLRVFAHARAMLETTPDLIPTHETRPPVVDALARGWAPDETVLDNCFTGWDGAAQLIWPHARVRFESAPAVPFLQIYAPAGGDIVCIEPQSAAPDAMNRDNAGVRALGPGESMALTMRFTFSD